MPRCYKKPQRKWRTFYPCCWVDASSDAVGYRLADKGYQIPIANEPGFVWRLLEIAKAEKAAVILPMVTNELEILSIYKDKFQHEGTVISISDITLYT